MSWLTDELLFYGGLTMAIIALGLLIIYMVVSRIALSRLKRRLNMEYGDER